MEFSPFSFGQVVHEEAFTNRYKEKKTLKETLLSGNSVILISPRRIGKSSLTKQVFTEIAHAKKAALVSIDITSYRSEEEFLEDFAIKLIQATSSKLKNWLTTIGSQLKQLTPSLQYGLAGQEEFSFTFNWTNYKKTKEEILRLPELLSTSSNKKIIIAIDEFQNISRFENSLSLQYELRSFWQHQKNVSYCLFGSKRHMMEEIFSSESAPLYNFGLIQKLKRINEKHWIPFIKDKFESTNKSISERHSKAICDWTQCHSEQVQFLAHFIWTSCPSKKAITSEHMINGMLRYLDATNTPSTDLFDKLSSIQLNLIRAILNNEEKLTSKKILDKYQLRTSASALKAKKALLKDDVLEQTGQNNYRLINPAFEYWIRRKVMRQDILSMYKELL